ncbi:hypothetical protein LB507_005080 [Fusarium sp. FIESC RH6]|nr:hypothetical protein LB507_005080 [Fusarium sp. FIESC RH6]
MAARKIKILFQNNTQQTLNWVDSGVEHGERSVVAPDQINSRDTGNWALESDGFATGCEGWMTWRIGDNGPTVTLEYSNPYVGEISYSCSVDSNAFTVDWNGGSNDWVEVRFFVNQKETPQDDDDDSC